MESKKGLITLVFTFLFFIFSFFLTNNLHAASNKIAKCWFNLPSNSKANINLKTISGEPFLCDTSAGLIQIDKIDTNYDNGGMVNYSFSGFIKFKKSLQSVQAFLEPTRSDYLKSHPWLPHPFVEIYSGSFFKKPIVGASEKIPFKAALTTKSIWAKQDKCAANEVVAKIFITTQNTNIGEIQIDLAQYPAGSCLPSLTPTLTPSPTTTPIPTESPTPTQTTTPTPTSSPTVAPTNSPTPMATPTPTLTFTPSPTPQNQTLLFDDFNETQLNENIWEVFENGGTYDFQNGKLFLPGGGGIPLFRSRSNPFPSNKPYSVEFGLQFTSSFPSGSGVGLGYIKQPNSFVPENVPVAYWQDSSSGWIIHRFHLTEKILGPSNFNYHKVKISYDLDKYLVYVDDVFQYTSPSSPTSQSLWFGHPLIGVNQPWTGFSIDYIEVTTP